MHVLTLEEIKSQLRIDSAAEDNVLTGFEAAAVEYLETIYLGQTLDEIKGTDDDYPAPLKIWILVAIGQMNENRENFDFSKLPHGYISHYREAWGFGGPDES